MEPRSAGAGVAIPPLEHDDDDDDDDDNDDDDDERSVGCAHRRKECC
jgi:hypothetical protein